VDVIRIPDQQILPFGSADRVLLTGTKPCGSGGFCLTRLRLGR
jgi:hypothetical protein